MNKSTTVPASTPAESGRGFFGHPWGLANLAGVEMWERFSFYGMQSLLLGYIVLQVSSGGLGMSAAEGSSIIGAYAGWVYLAAVIGSWISDRLLGSERTLVLGASIIMAGHIALSTIPGIPGLVTGLVLVGLGSGTLKATTSTVLGSMYSLEDRRRDAAFQPKRKRHTGDVAATDQLRGAQFGQQHLGACFVGGCADVDLKPFGAVEDDRGDGERGLRLQSFIGNRLRT